MLCLQSISKQEVFQHAIFFRKTLISQLLNKISKIWLRAFLARVKAVFMQNFSPLTIKFRELFEVADKYNKNN